jgi:hypothetical protein
MTLIGTPFFHIWPKPLYDFYKDLLGTPLPSSNTIDLAPLVESTSLTATQVASLVRPFTLDDIRAALFSMNGNSSLGPDGFGPTLFKNNLPVVKGCLLDSLSDFHSLSADLRPINKSYIVLLPKKAGQQARQLQAHLPSKLLS